MTTRISKIMTRSETAKMKKREADMELYITSHQYWSVTDGYWSPRFHNLKCSGYVHVSVDDNDDDNDEPCRCCIAQLFRAEGKSNPCNVACKICFNWKGPLPGTKEV
jgi:hypothetical protein